MWWGHRETDLWEIQTGRRKCKVIRRLEGKTSEKNHNRTQGNDEIKSEGDHGKQKSKSAKQGGTNTVYEVTVWFPLRVFIPEWGTEPEEKACCLAGAPSKTTQCRQFQMGSAQQAARSPVGSRRLLPSASSGRERLRTSSKSGKNLPHIRFTFYESLFLSLWLSFQARAHIVSSRRVTGLHTRAVQ